MSKLKNRRIAFHLILLAFFCAGIATWSILKQYQHALHIDRTLAQRTGSYFTPAPPDPFQAPSVTEIPIPGFPGGDAIWGATGRDDRGHIWFGVTEKAGSHSARLFEYAPESGQVNNRGSVVDHLWKAGLSHIGEGQIKIHSKIIPADDGYLYFASLDEEGENADGSKLPTWGSHLWRVHPATHRWEHLFGAPEGLIAVSGTGQWIYALGYWDHILYQYNIRTSNVNRVRVGSEGGHISRNLVADYRGHVYVPMVKYFDMPQVPGGDSNTTDRFLVTTLIEYDENLNVIGTTPLTHYADDEKPAGNHGIIALTYLADGSVVFATHLGYLYQIVPSADGPASVTDLGWFHPEGSSYTPSLFTYAGERFLLGLGRRKQQYDWLVYDLQTNSSTAVPFNFDGSGDRLLLYGSVTRDQAGRFYVAGRHYIPGKNKPMPLLLQVSVGN